MSKYSSPLKDLRVASPCSANWSEMFGDDRKRFCGECKLHVYNLSGMTRDDAENLIMNAEGRVCVRYYRRPDGTVITQDCPVGLARLRQRTRAAFTAFASMLFALISGVFIVSLFSGKTESIGEMRIPFITPVASPTPDSMPTMGAIQPMPPKPEPTPKVTVHMGNIAAPPAKATTNAAIDRELIRSLRDDNATVDIN